MQVYFAKLLVFSSIWILILNSSQPLAQTVWSKYPTPVLSLSATFPDWNGLATADACVIKDNDTLKMWYSGSGWITSTDDCPHVRMGYAWSLDGITWQQHPSNPVLNIGTNPSDFDYDGVETPHVIKDLTAPANQRYKLWYAGRKSRCQPVNDHSFGYAYSPDGIHWTKYPGNPILMAGTSSDWYNTFISNPCVLQDSSGYKMWFTAPDLVINNQPTDGKGNIGYATSSDGINWNIYSSPVLVAGDQFNWDAASIAEPSVLKIDSNYYMFYSALDQWAVENFQVGYAWSSDGVNWIKSTQNPVLSVGNSNQWDRFWASHPGVIYDSSDNKLKMWYTGRDTATITSLTDYYWDIGFAECPFLLGNDVISKDVTIMIYPNPSNGTVSVSWPTDLGKVNIILYNSLGSIVKNSEESNLSHLTLEIQDLPDGIYNLTLKTNLKEYHNRIIIYK